MRDRLKDVVSLRVVSKRWKDICWTDSQTLTHPLMTMTFKLYTVSNNLLRTLQLHQIIIGLLKQKHVSVTRANDESVMAATVTDTATRYSLKC